MAMTRWSAGIICLATLLATGEQAPGQAPAPPKFATPRETLKTLYFSVLAYDFRPALIDDAVACLDPGTDGAKDFAELARLAVQLEAVLREISLGVNEVPDQPAGENKDYIVAYKADGMEIALARQLDGRWRFSASTVANVPAMYRQTLARHHDLRAARADLHNKFTDPAATMRFFFVEAMGGDYYAAVRSLDLSRIPVDQRDDQGPVLAQQLMFVIQRRGWVYFQEIPNNPDGPPYTWHADRDGRIVLERSRQPDGKDSWQFSYRTVKNLKAMYEAAINQPADARYVQLGRAVLPLAQAVSGNQRPASVPAHLGSPRALLKGFFRVMDEAELNDARLVGAAEFLDLEAVPPADRAALAVTLAPKLDGLLRKLNLDLNTVPDSWNAPRVFLGRDRGCQVELIRQRDGRWCVSHRTIEQLPQICEKMAAQQKVDRERSGHLETARDTMGVFLSAGNRCDHARAAQCLDLGSLHPSARQRCGPVLAYKLKYAIDRIGRVYPEEIPDEPDGPRYVFHNGDLGRIVIARKNDGPDKGKWLFTMETVERIEPMFLAAVGRPVDEALRGSPYAMREPGLEETPGIWLRLHVPPWGHRQVGSLELYQWFWMPVILFLVLVLGAKVVLTTFSAILAGMLRQFGSVLTGKFVASKVRPLTWVAAAWLFYRLLTGLDLPVSWLDTILATQAVVLALPLGWFGFRIVDLFLAVYTNSELIRPHRSLSDMVVPVCLRLLKGAILLLVLGHVVYQVGKGDSLFNFMTGLGAAGFAASLAAQDIIKSFFGTLLLVGERSFKLGDHIKVDGHEGIVEQVGFRSMRLRTTDGSLVTIPNSTIASASIDIRGEQTTHRHSATIALGKDLPVEQISSLRDRLHDWLRGNPAVDPDTAEVTIGLHRDSGAELQVNLLLHDVAAGDEAAVRHEINYAILKVVQDMQGGKLRQPALRQAV